MDGSKCVISKKTHSLVVNGAGKPTICEGNVLLHNRLANSIIQVPLTPTIMQMFGLEGKINPLPIESRIELLESCEGEDSQRDTAVGDSRSIAATQDLLVELLISEISKRPPLFNERLPLQERSRSIKAALEREVYEALGGQMPLENISKKWAYLKKEYRRQRADLNKYVKSGCSLEEAAKITGKPIWKHYLSLRFIDDANEEMNTQSNVPSVVELSDDMLSPTQSESSSMSMVSPRSALGSARACDSDTPVTKKRKITNTVEASVSEKLVDKMILAELQKKNSNTTTTLDSCDHFCAMLALEMKKLDNRKRAELQVKVLTMLNQALYDDDDI